MQKVRTPTFLAALALWPAVVSGQVTNVIPASANAFVYRGSASAWTANLTWNNQPAKTASPNDIPGSSSALPNANTTAVCAQNSTAVGTVTFDNVSIDQPSFDLSLSPDIQSVNGNGTVSFTNSLQNNFGFKGNVALSDDGIPPYATATFTPAAISGTNTSILVITTTNITPPGSYELVISGTNGTLCDQETVTLQVTDSIDSDGDRLPDWWMQQSFGHPTGHAGGGRFRW